MESSIRFTDPYGAPSAIEATEDGHLLIYTVNGAREELTPEIIKRNLGTTEVIEITREDLSRILPVLTQFVSTGKWDPSLAKRV